MSISDYFSRWSKISVIALCLLLVVLVGIVDYLLGEQISAALFYLLPISISSWVIGRRAGFVMSAVSAATWITGDVVARQNALHPLIHFWNTLMSFGFFWIVSYTLSALKASLEQEKALARIDPLTGVINRRHFEELANMEIHRSKRFMRPFTAAYIDVDNFKNVNDRFGHDEGDKLLRHVADAMQGHLRETDIVARLGGDEFIVLLPETDYDHANIVFSKMNEYLIALVNKQRWQVTFSIGVVTFVTPPVSVDEMIKNADALMYAGKRGGKNMIRFEALE